MKVMQGKAERGVYGGGGGLVVSDSCNPMVCILPGSSVHGILQAKILEWVAISFSRGSSQPRDQTQASHIAGRFFYHLSHQGIGIDDISKSSIKLHEKKSICIKKTRCLFIVFIWKTIH